MNLVATYTHRALSGTILVDLDGHLVAIDPAIAQSLSLDPATPHALYEVADADQVQAALARIAAGEIEVILATSLTTEAAESAGSVEMRFRRLLGPAGQLVLVTITPEVKAYAPDALTGLPDRRALAERLAAWRAASADRSLHYAVLFLDLDDFKQVNDEHGHAVGDKVLTAVAQRIVQCVREGDLVVRYGGDEFVLLLRDVEAREAAEPVVDRLHHCIGEPVQVGALRLQVSASIGVSIEVAASRSLEDAIDAADRDMYARKRRRPK